jgi:transitional endoplasmic reticulum ATPase
MDEIDQSDVSARGNGSGNPAAKNPFSQLLRFLSDPANRGRVVFFGASNRPDLIDEALLRSKRIDAIIPVLLPEESERATIAQAAAAAAGFTLTEQAAAVIAAAAVKYSAADIAALIDKAGEYAEDEESDCITPPNATRALASFRPRTLKNADYYTLLAVDACNDNDLLPPAYAALLNDRSTLSTQIEEMSPAPRQSRREI